MGRKIPAKKHKGVKDPLEQQARRIKSEQGRVNAPPADPDDQPVPKSLLRLFGARALGAAPAPAARPGPRRDTRRKKGAAGAGAGNPVSRLARAPGESPRQFARRITDAARSLHGTPARYPGEEEEEEEEDGRGARRAARRGRGRAGPPAPPALTRGQKLTLKKKAKKEEADQVRVSEPQYERVAFGDVAHAPPALPAPRAAPRPAGAARPGRRGLLLSAMLGQGVTSPAPPAADARRRERARADAVAAYRQLKAERGHGARRT